MRSRGCQRQGGSEGLAVDDARAGFLAEFQLHAGSKPALGTTQAVVEGGPVNVLGALRKNDGRALKPQWLLAGLEDQLGLVVPPGAIGSSNDCLAVGGDGGDGAVEDVIPIMLLGVVLHLGIAPTEDSKLSGTQPKERGQAGLLNLLELAMFMSSDCTDSGVAATPATLSRGQKDFRTSSCWAISVVHAWLCLF